jgi:hypothetical protein
VSRADKNVVSVGRKVANALTQAVTTSRLKRFSWKSFRLISFSLGFERRANLS